MCDGWRGVVFGVVGREVKFLVCWVRRYSSWCLGERYRFRWVERCSSWCGG
jgi:hypothetical protein